MTEDETALPPGCVWRKAADLRGGDKVCMGMADGSFESWTVSHTEKCTWARTTEGPALTIVFRNPKGDQIAGRSDEFAILA